MAARDRQYTTTEETANFARISRIVVDVFRDILWEVLRGEILPANLPREIQANKVKLEKYLHENILTKFCPNTLGRHIPVPAPNDFDVSALYTLLRNLGTSVPSPTKGWGKTPDPADKNLADDIERVRLFRNDTYGHLTTATINNAEFNTMGSNIKTFVERFDVFFRGKGIKCDFTRDIVELLTCPIDEPLPMNYVEEMRKNAEIPGVNKTTKALVFDERNHSGDAERSTLTTEGVENKGHSATKTSLPAAVQVHDDSRDDKEEIIQGNDGKIFLIKHYVNLKSELTRELVMDIVKILFKQNNCEDILEEMENASSRRHCIENFLKRIISGKSADVTSFLEALKSMCPKMAELIAQANVTNEDRKKFKRINDKSQARPCTVSSVHQCHVNYFQYRPEQVSQINDALLSRFHLSIRDHSDFTRHLEEPETIHYLFKIILSCYSDLKSGLQSLLEPKMYENWQEFENESSELTDQENPGLWHSVLQWIQDAATSLMEFISESFQIVFLGAERGSVILKFLAGDNFIIDLLTPESVKRKLKLLLETTCHQLDLIFEDPVHVMVFIKSPKDAGKEEIHFYLETDKDVKEIDGCHSHKERYERDYMVEEMDPAPLKQWTLENVQMDENTRNQLEDPVSWEMNSRREKMRFLLDIMRRYKNGYEQIESYCEKNEKFVYNKLFKEGRQWSSIERQQTDQLTELAYKKGGGLQKLFSTWIYFTEDPEEEEKMMSGDMKELYLLPLETQQSEEERTLGSPGGKNIGKDNRPVTVDEQPESLPEDDFETSIKLLTVSIDFGTTYSGYAISFNNEYKRDRKKIHTQRWMPCGYTKTPTVLLLDSEKEFVAFGFDAENKYAELADENAHHGYYYFHHFKMALNENLSLSRNKYIKDEQGKRIHASVVFMHSIRYLKGMIEKYLQNRDTKLKEGEIQWILTVPVIWSDASKRIMREAAVNAGIKEKDLWLRLESEAASIYCIDLTINREASSQSTELTAIREGSNFVVVDMGGSTVDMTVKQVVEGRKLKNLHEETLSCGGSKVNENFRLFMGKLLGQEVWNKFCSVHMFDKLELERDFEIKKRDIHLDTENRIPIRLPFAVQDVFKEVTKKDLTNAIAIEAGFQGKVEMKRGKLILDVKLFQSFFDDSVKGIVDHLKMLLKNINIETIFLVGGFAESPLVCETIRKNFSGKLVVTHIEAGLCVLKGALLHVYEKKTIIICKHTYGTGALRHWMKGYDPEEEKDMIDDQGFCKVFVKYAEIGQTVHMQETFTREIDVLKATMSPIRIPVYISKKRNPVFISDPACLLLGNITLDVSHVSGGNNSKVIISMIFTESKFQVKAVIGRSGLEYTTSFDFGMRHDI